MSICHLQGNGTYNLITINSNALSAHEAHGDLPVGAAVPGGDVTLDAECVPRRDVTGTYTLRSLGDDHELPVLGTGELIHSMEIVLNADGSCSISGYFQGDQDDPDGVIEYFAFASCSYSLDGTELTFTLGDGEGGEFSMTVPLVGDQITLQIRIWNEAEGTTEEDAPFGDAVFVKV